MKYVVPAMLLVSMALMGCSSQVSSGADAKGTPIAPVLPVTSSQEIDPCDEYFQALTNAFRNKPGSGGTVTEQGIDIEVWGYSTLHTSVQLKNGYHSWRYIISQMYWNCRDKYEIVFNSGLEYGDENVYEDGVSVKRKPVQNLSIPTIDLPPVRNAIITIATLFGLGVLGGLGAKKALA